MRERRKRKQRREERSKEEEEIYFIFSHEARHTRVMSLLLLKVTSLLICPDQTINASLKGKMIECERDTNKKLKEKHFSFSCS